MTKTRDDLVRKALDVLGVAAVGQPVETEDYDKVNGEVDTLIDALSELEIVYVGDIDAIPNAWFKALADILAEECKSEFGLTAEDVVRLEAARTTAEGRLRVMNRGKPTGEPAKNDYF